MNSISHSINLHFPFLSLLVRGCIGREDWPLFEQMAMNKLHFLFPSTSPQMSSKLRHVERAPNSSSLSQFVSLFELPWASQNAVIVKINFVMVAGFEDTFQNILYSMTYIIIQWSRIIHFVLSYNKEGVQMR